MDIYSSFTQNCQIWETTKMLCSGWVDKQTVVHPGNGKLFGAKKRWAIQPWKDLEEVQITKRKKPIWKTSHHMIPTIWHSRKGIMKTVKCLVARDGAIGGREWGKWEERKQWWTCGAQALFLALKPVCLILWWWIHTIILLSKPTEFLVQHKQWNLI